MKARNMKRLSNALLLAFAVCLVGAVALATAALATNENGGGHTPITICHHAGPDPENWHTITVDDDSVTLNAHLGHGDTIGPCEEEEEPPTTTTEPTTPTETTPTETTPDEGNAPVVIDKGGSKGVTGESPKAQPKGVPSEGTPQGQAQAQPNQGNLNRLPYTGANAGILAGIAALLGAAGFGLRRKFGVDQG